MENQNDQNAEQNLLVAIAGLQLPMNQRLKLDKLIEDALNEAYIIGIKEGKEEANERIRLGYPVFD